MSRITASSTYTLPLDDYFSKDEEIGRSSSGTLLREGVPRAGPVETESGRNPNEPRLDGGLKAWLQVLGAFFLLVNSWGIVNCFGVFQTYYQIGILSDESPSNISWIGSIQAFLLLFVGVVTGPLYDAGYFHALIRLGSFLTVFGLMMTSISTQYYQVMLAQGVCIGFGSGCFFVPSYALIPQYFSKRKAFALGIVASGSSIGAIIYPIVFHVLQPKIGFPWATRVLGFLALVGCVISMCVMRVKVLPAERRALFDLTAFKEVPFTVFTVSLFLAFAGLYVPIFYIQSYAIQEHITNTNLGFYILPILSAGSVFGRIIPPFIADTTGPLNMLIPCAFASGVLALGWIGVKDVPGLVIFALLYGFSSGAFVSLPAIAIVTLSPSLRVVGTRLGMCFAVTSMGILIGTPVSGVLLNSTGSWTGAQVFSGVTLLVAVIGITIARSARYGLRLAVIA